MNSELHRNVLLANFNRKVSRLIGRSFIVQQDNEPKHTDNTTNDFSGGEKVDAFRLSMSITILTQLGSISPPDETNND